MATHDGLTLDLHPGDHSLQLQLAGDLDVASAGRLRAALAWLRRRRRGMLVIDSQELDFVDLTGYRVLEEAVRHPNGCPDPFVVHVEGRVVTRLRWQLATARRDHPAGSGRVAM
jgi:anti-anti-sigma factor